MLGSIGAFDDLDVHALENDPQRILELRPLISAIGVELQKEGIEAEHRRHQEHAAVTVLNIRAMHDGVHQEALRVDENMPLLAFDLLARIVPMRVVSPPHMSECQSSGLFPGDKSPAVYPVSEVLSPLA